ncbi:hypothetical protein KXW63_000394 [Aspergillus fumigatus]|nr:hypothetical protein KXW63_000394 [Aspergillus fumigatus]
MYESFTVIRNPQAELPAAPGHGPAHDALQGRLHVTRQPLMFVDSPSRYPRPYPTARPRPSSGSWTLRLRTASTGRTRWWGVTQSPRNFLTENNKRAQAN